MSDNSPEGSGAFECLPEEGCLELVLMILSAVSEAESLNDGGAEAEESGVGHGDVGE
ncbi:MAG: hypothetical protein ACOZAN_03545 [Patescibacteria group bacterium]